MIKSPKITPRIHTSIHRSSTSACILQHNHLLRAAPERQVPNREPQNHRNKHAPIERHDRQHQQVPDRRVDPEQHGTREPRRPRADSERPHQKRRLEIRVALLRRDHFESDPTVLHVLVENREEEADEEGEGVARPGVGAPRVEEESYLFAPVEGHVHHGSVGVGLGFWR
ncbi:hypothetical protein Sjap_011925 [Stephania japonica]|uniref:Uncharacterized protein n=1 Tax=Stephania japonica TaxID=461633 RepID=A0AAP0P5F5_9MAGN